MRLTELLRRIKTGDERLQNLPTGAPGTLASRTRETIQRSIEHYNKEIDNFGSGLPIFKIKYWKTNKKKYLEYMQAETEEEARAAILLIKNKDILADTVEIKMLPLRSPIVIKDNDSIS